MGHRNKRMGDAWYSMRANSNSPLNQGVGWGTKVSTFLRESHTAIQNISQKAMAPFPINPSVKDLTKDIKKGYGPGHSLAFDIMKLPGTVHESYKKKIKQTETAMKGGPGMHNPAADLSLKKDFVKKIETQHPLVRVGLAEEEEEVNLGRTKRKGW
tara:strand:- start:43 stop:510 length:468 start_codon:yes stop_codon:yes gene_type:complete